jgi:hypothetical protein
VSFIETEEGWVNPAHVVSIKTAPVSAKNGDARYLLYDAEGKVLDVVQSGIWIEWENFTAPVVPAAPNTTAYVVWTDPLDNKARPTETAILVESRAVLAWRLVEYPEPFLMDPPTGAAVLHPLPDGQLLLIGDTTFDSLEAAKAGLLASAQVAWDRKQASKAVA